jgi:hypothetical protein
MMKLKNTEKYIIGTLEKLKMVNAYVTYYCHLRKWVSRLLETDWESPTAAERGREVSRDS